MQKLYRVIKSKFYELFGHPRKYVSDYKWISQCKNILDVPCGRGFFIENSPDNIVGADLQQIALHQCLEKGYNVCNANVIKMPFGNESFDATHCAHLIEHLFPNELVRCIEELDRVLSVGGILIFRSPVFHRLFFEDLSHIRPYPPSGILGLLNVSDSGDPTFVLSALKYEFLSLRYYHRNLFATSLPVSLRPIRYLPVTVLRSLGVVAGRLGVRSWFRNEYRLIVKGG